MDWITKHTDTVIVLMGIVTSIISSMLWMNGKFNELDKRLTVIETVLMCKGIMPNTLAALEGK